MRVWHNILSCKYYVSEKKTDFQRFIIKCIHLIYLLLGTQMSRRGFDIERKLYNINLIPFTYFIILTVQWKRWRVFFALKWVFKYFVAYYVFLLRVKINGHYLWFSIRTVLSGCYVIKYFVRDMHVEKKKEIKQKRETKTSVI